MRAFDRFQINHLLACRAVGGFARGLIEPWLDYAQSATSDAVNLANLGAFVGPLKIIGLAYQSSVGLQQCVFGSANLFFGRLGGFGDEQAIIPAIQVRRVASADIEDVVGNVHALFVAIGHLVHVGRDTFEDHAFNLERGGNLSALRTGLHSEGSKRSKLSLVHGGTDIEDVDGLLFGKARDHLRNLLNDLAIALFGFLRYRLTG